MNVYLAGPLFTLADRRFNEEFARELERLCPTLDIFLPQRCDGEFLGAPDFHQKVYACLMRAVERCDAVVALLDGADADSGTCIEMGFAHARGKKVVGVRTDFRGCEDHGLNLMVSNLCAELIMEPSTSATLDRIAARVVHALNSFTP